MDDLGIDQGAGEEAGLDFPSFGQLVSALYANQDNEESVWERARVGLTRLIGPGLGDTELLARTDAVFRDLDADGSGGLVSHEPCAALRKLVSLRGYYLKPSSPEIRNFAPLFFLRRCVILQCRCARC